MKILIAEDDPVLNHLLDRHCRIRGYETTVAFDARQTWAHVVKGQPDLVLLDIKMPGGSGIAILKRIHQSPKTSSIPVVVITGVDDPLVLRMVKEQRPDAILSKPLDIGTLDEELERLLNGRPTEPRRPESTC
jgi:CheY-like chemotaxis protein